MEVAMFKPLGIDHVVLRVSDQARSQRFYEDVLGCTLAKFNERISLIHLRFGEALIDRQKWSGPTGPASVAGKRSISCDDLKAVAEELRRKAVALEGDVVQRFGAFGDGPSLYLRDPDGHMIELKPRS